MKNEQFSHGPNILGQHVDVMVTLERMTVIKVRKATEEEIEEYCDES